MTKITNYQKEEKMNSKNIFKESNGKLSRKKWIDNPRINLRTNSKMSLKMSLKINLRIAFRAGEFCNEKFVKWQWLSHEQIIKSCKNLIRKKVVNWNLE